MHMNESVIVSLIIKNLPPSWRDFKRSLKHKNDDIFLDKLAKSFQVGEEFKLNVANVGMLKLVKNELELHLETFKID